MKPDYGSFSRTDWLVLMGASTGVIGFAMLNPAFGLLFFSVVCFVLLGLHLYSEAHQSAPPDEDTAR